MARFQGIAGGGEPLFLQDLEHVVGGEAVDAQPFGKLGVVDRPAELAIQLQERFAKDLLASRKFGDPLHVLPKKPKYRGIDKIIEPIIKIKHINIIALGFKTKFLSNLLPHQNYLVYYRYKYRRQHIADPHSVFYEKVKTDSHNYYTAYSSHFAYYQRV